jgi:hypothetical protein
VAVPQDDDRMLISIPACQDIIVLRLTAAGPFFACPCGKGPCDHEDAPVTEKSTWDGSNEQLQGEDNGPTPLKAVSHRDPGGWVSLGLYTLTTSPANFGTRASGFRCLIALNL